MNQRLLLIALTELYTNRSTPECFQLIPFCDIFVVTHTDAPAVIELFTEYGVTHPVFGENITKVMNAAGIEVAEKTDPNSYKFETGFRLPKDVAAELRQKIGIEALA